MTAVATTVLTRVTVVATTVLTRVTVAIGETGTAMMKTIVSAPSLLLVVKATAEVSRIVKAFVNALMRRLKPVVFLLKMQKPGLMLSVAKEMMTRPTTLTKVVTTPTTLTTPTTPTTLTKVVTTLQLKRMPTVRLLA